MAVGLGKQVFFDNSYSRLQDALAQSISLAHPSHSFTSRTPTIGLIIGHLWRPNARIKKATKGYT